MDEDKIISFEEYRNKKSDTLSEEDNLLSTILNKDLREQNDLLDWYSFHHLFNGYKLFLHSLFQRNHSNKGINPRCGFIMAFTQKQIQMNIKYLVEALE